MSGISQKDYLKKYLGIGKGSVEKKKKKKSKKTLNGLKIVDDDLDVNLSQEIQVDLTADNEEAPQIVSVIDDRPPSLRIDEVTHDHLWKPIGAPDIISTSEKSLQLKGNIKFSKDFNKSSLKSSHQGSIERHEGLKPPKAPHRPEHSLAQNSENIDDFSPPRKNKRCNYSPKSSDRPRSSPDQNFKNSDISPPRKNKRNNNSDFDSSPPRRDKNRDERLKLLKSSDRPRGSDSQNSRNIDDFSPPRKDKRGNTSDLDDSPPRRDKNDLFSRDIGSKKRLSQGRSSKTTQSSDNDASPPRKASTKRSRWGDPDDKMKKTLDGKTAGLQNATDLISETQKLKEREDEIFKNMSAEVSGANAATIVRGKKEINWKEEERRRKKAEESKEKYDKWGRGLKQVDDVNEKIKNELYEMSKPLARYADDKDLEKYLKDQEREGDPMLAYIRGKKKKKAVEEGKPVIQQYEGDAPPNRFAIRPGYRWDGVDRSNGYEKQWFEVQNSRKANIEESYKWSTEDM